MNEMVSDIRRLPGAVKVLGAGAMAVSGAFLLWREATAEAHSSFKLRDIMLLIFKAFQSKRIRNITLSSIALTWLINRFRKTKVGGRWGRFYFQIFASSWALYYCLYCGESPVVRCQKSLFNRQIIQKANLTETYWPCFWLTNKDAMTALGSFFGDIEFLLFYDLKLKTEVLPCYDGVNSFNLDWYKPQQKGVELVTKGSADPVMIVVHGLGGNSDAHYLKKFAKDAHGRGWRCCSYDWWRLDFGEWRDLEIAVNYIAEHNPEAPIVIVAYSAGTHITLRYLQESGKSSPLVAAVCVSCVQDLMAEYFKIRDTPGRSVYKSFVDRTIKAMAMRSCETDKRTEKKAGMITALKKYSDCDWYDCC